jgi:hypothetical protein
MYYLNAFNEMLRKRQRQNMMGGEGYQGGGNAPPSGPMGARQTGNFMTNVRDLLNNPYVGFAASVTPFRAPFAAAKLGVSAYDRLQANQNPYSDDDSMDRLSFNAPAYGQAGPDFGPYPNSSVDPSAYEGAMSTNSFNAFNMGGGPGVSGSRGAPNFDPNDAFVAASRAAYSAAPEAVVGGSIGPVPTGEAIAPISTDMGSFYGGSDNNANTGNFGGVTGGADALGNAIGFGGTYAHGGMVDARHLKGRAPAPDDGYGALQGGEYVITKAAVEKYGKRLLDAINNGTFR